MLVSTASLSAAPRWLRLETEDFVIVSDARESDIVEFAAGYSGYRYAFRRLFLPDGKRVPRSQILLFRHGSDFESRVPQPKDGRSRTICHGGDLDGGAFLALAVDGDREAALKIAYEFETIWGLRRSGYNIPLWMSQGAGEVLCSLQMRKGKCIVGERPTGFDEIGASALRWPRFFDVNTGSAEYSGREAKGVFHEQAWALMHWILLRDEETLSRFQALADAVHAQPSSEAVQSVMQVKTDELTKTINRHLFGFQTRKIDFDEAAVRASYRIVPATEAEAHALLANLAAESDRPVEADRELQIAQKLAPDAPYVQEALARREMRERRVNEAAVFYRRAIEAGSTNPRAYVISAMARLNESSSGGVDYSGGGGRNVEVALGDLRHALELDPGNTEAYQQLGRAFFLAPTPSAAGLDELARGVTDDPKTLSVLEYRAALLQRLKRTDEYLDQLQAIVTHPDAPPQTVQRLEKRWLKGVLDRDIAKMNALVAKHEFAEAAAFVEAERKTPAGERLQGEYEQMAEYVGEQSSWVALRRLRQEQHWAEAAEAAQKYLDVYPKSKRLAAVEKLRDEARQHLASSNQGTR